MLNEPKWNNHISCSQKQTFNYRTVFTWVPFYHVLASFALERKNTIVCLYVSYMFSPQGPLFWLFPRELFFPSDTLGRLRFSSEVLNFSPGCVFQVSCEVVFLQRTMAYLQTFLDPRLSPFRPTPSAAPSPVRITQVFWSLRRRR